MAGRTIKNKEITTEDILIKLDVVQTKVKFQAFGKITIKDNKENHVEKDVDKKVKPTEVLAEEIIREQIKKADDEIQEIKRKKSNRVGRIWDIRKKMIGGRKATGNQVQS